MLAARVLGDLARGIAWPASLVPLALVLAAMVNAKQSGIGLENSLEGLSEYTNSQTLVTHKKAAQPA